MKYEFKDILDPPEVIHIQTRKKYANFTVTEIGGPEQLAAWKIDQAAKWEAYQANRAAFKEKQKQFIAGPDAPQGDKVTWAGSGTNVSNRDVPWQDKMQQAMEARKKLFALEPISAERSKPYEPMPEPKLSVLGRIKKAFWSFWGQANF